MNTDIRYSKQDAAETGHGWYAVRRFALAYIATREGQNPMVLIASSAHALRRLMDRHVEVKV